MIKVLLSDLRAYIEGQPRDRRIEMNQVGFHCELGDLMVQYGRHMGWDFDYCGARNWRKMIKGDTVIIACIEDGDVFSLFKDRRITSKYKYTYQTLIDNFA